MNNEKQSASSLGDSPGRQQTQGQPPFITESELVEIIRSGRRPVYYVRRNACSLAFLTSLVALSCSGLLFGLLVHQGRAAGAVAAAVVLLAALAVSVSIGGELCLMLLTHRYRQQSHKMLYYTLLEQRWHDLRGRGIQALSGRLRLPVVPRQTTFGRVTASMACVACVAGMACWGVWHGGTLPPTLVAGTDPSNATRMQRTVRPPEAPQPAIAQEPVARPLRHAATTRTASTVEHPESDHLPTNDDQPQDLPEAQSAKQTLDLPYTDVSPVLGAEAYVRCNCDCEASSIAAYYNNVFFG